MVADGDYPPKAYSNDASSSDDTSNDANATLGVPDVEETPSHTTDHIEIDNVLESVKSVAHTAKRRLHLDNVHATGPSKVFNPTNVRARIRWGDDDSTLHESSDDKEASFSKKLDPRNEAFIMWRARENRKGRNSEVVTSEDLERKSKIVWSDLRQVAKNVLLMFISFPYWDLAFWSGWSFSVGSALFVMDGAWAWYPIAYPEVPEFPGYEWAVGLGFFIGALFYQIGATTAYLEAVNDGSWQGSAMRRLLAGNDLEQKKMVDAKIASFFGHLVPHPKRRHKRKIVEMREREIDPEAGWLNKDRQDAPGSSDSTEKKSTVRRGGIDYGEAEEGHTSTYRTFRWIPDWEMLKTHHVYEVGFLACSIQLFGATLYTMCGIVALPPIIDSLNEAKTDGAYYGPEIVASICFVVASALFTLESQENWYKPEFGVIGWWIGFWATVGSVGFLLNGSFGPASYYYEWADYQSELSSTWGSFCFLLSGCLQWYESINKNPVVELFNEPGEMKSSQIHPA